MQFVSEAPDTSTLSSAVEAAVTPTPRMDWADDLARTLAERLDVKGVAVLAVPPGEPALLGAFPRRLHVGCEAFRVIGDGQVWDAELEDGLAATGYPFFDQESRILGGVVLLDSPEHLAARREGLAEFSPFITVALQSASSAAGANVEHRLRQAQARLHSLTNAVQMCVVVLDPRGFVREANCLAAEMLGYDPDQLIGMHFRDLLAPDEHAEATGRFEQRIRGVSVPVRSEMQVIRGDGIRRLMLATAAPLFDEDEVVGVYFAARDITDEREREIELRRAERFSGLAPLLGGVCHELNNPLTSIKSFAELMLLDDRPEEDRESLDIIQREAERAARIVSDLKVVARQTQSDGPSVSPVQLNSLVRSVTDARAREIGQAGIELSVSLGEDVPEIYASRQQLERVVEQLLSNAIHAVAGCDVPRSIEIRTETASKGIRLTVADSGPGIAERDVERIFDPFWTTRTTGEGSGLGLSLVHGIVRDHNGQIRVDGGQGTGATFVIELSGMEMRERSPREPDVQDPSRKPLRILIVDDEGPIRFSLGRYMTRRGHTVEEAEEGEKAMRLIEKNGAAAFDIILADLRMPGLNGEQLFNRLRERGKGDEERLIFITGDADSPDAASLVEEAGVPVVLKPFELAEIAQIIEVQADVIG